MERNEFRLQPQTITDDDRARRRIRDHVDLILALARVPSAARDDLYEELYSHLWERWRASVDAGTPPEQAAREAIATFGEAASTAGDLASTYHSRLYMSTIGALVPLVARTGEPPAAIDYLADYLRVVAAYDLVAGVGIAIWLSPVRMATALAATAIAVAFNVLAARALDRGQRWALRYAQLLVPVVLVLGAIGLFSTPRNDGAVLAAVVTACVVPFSLGSAAATWVADGRRLRRSLSFGLAAALAVSVAGGTFASAIPDPTQVGPNALTVTVSLECASTTTATVTTEIVWSRTDVWPTGPFAFTHESVLVLVDNEPPGTAWPGAATAADQYSTTAADYPPGGVAPVGEYAVAGAHDLQPTSWAHTDGGAGLVIRSDMLQPGHRYRLTSTVSSSELPIVRAIVLYDHAAGFQKTEFFKRTDVGCGGSARAVSVPDPWRP